MKTQLSVLIFILIQSNFFLGQGGFTKGKKGNDYILVKKNGFHFALGGTYTLTGDSVNGSFDNSNLRGDYSLNPSGNFGFFAEFGFLQFPSWKGIPIGFMKKSRIMDYWEFAFGYRQLAGREQTTIYLKDINNQVYSSETHSGDFLNGFVYARASAHSLIFVGKKKIDKARKYFIDQNLGFNIDYNLFQSEKRYNENNYSAPLEQKFHGQMVTQLHYGIGFGIRINRAWMCIPGISMPILNLYEWNGWNAKLNWFSSQYRPLQVQIKFNKLYEIAPKCGAYGNPDDIKLNKKYQMGGGL